ncbi:hypothetical protein ACXR0O_21060 [Verrucomicrobiota bacterium sgz303538]
MTESEVPLLCFSRAAKGSDGEKVALMSGSESFNASGVSLGKRMGLQLLKDNLSQTVWQATAWSSFSEAAFCALMRGFVSGRAALCSLTDSDFDRCSFF